MTSTVSKRSQARNEKNLQDLIRTVPGNDRCADCGARNPGWASWSLGIFICMRCASLHRKLGTHISKVKSLSMDSWSNEQVENMKQNGNVNVNRHFNPQNSKPSIPADVDDVDPVFEKYIRQKYDQRVFSGGTSQALKEESTGGTRNSIATRSSDTDIGSLPPKPQKRFAFNLRSASAILPRGRSQPASPVQPFRAGNNWETDRIRTDKASRVFGVSVGGLTPHNRTTDGQSDGSREASTETKSRLPSLNEVSTDHSGMVIGLSSGGQREASRSRPSAPVAHGMGISIGDALPAMATASSPIMQYTRPSRLSIQTSSVDGLGMNPFLSYASQSANPYDASHDHRLRMASMDHAFANMNVTQQSLFPNATGGYPTPLVPLPDGRYQSMTPPISSTNAQFFTTNPYYQHSQPSTLNNPFLRQAGHSHPKSASPIAPSPLQHSTPSFTAMASPIAQQTSFQSGPPPSHYPQPATQTSSNYSQPYVSPQLPCQIGLQHPGANEITPASQSQVSTLLDQNPSHLNSHFPPRLPAQSEPQTVLYSAPLTAPSPWPGTVVHPNNSQFLPQQYQNSTFPNHAQQAQIDKSSILALYNTPSKIQTPSQISCPVSQPPAQPASDTSIPASYSAAPNLSASMYQVVNPPFTPTSPAPMASKNPFHVATPPPPPPPPPHPSSQTMAAATTGITPSIIQHGSQQSVDIRAYGNGRHSPDAFANLSARYI